MKTTWLIAALLCVALSSGAWAGPGVSLIANPFTMSPRQLSMGGAAIGVADDAGAWGQNPAGLAALNVAASEDKNWASDAILFSGFTPSGADYDIVGGSWSGWKPADKFGIGGGLGRWAEEYNFGGIGIGTQFRQTKLLVGVNFQRYNIEFLPWANGESIYNAGLMYPFSDSFKLGARIDNLTQIRGEKRYYDAGFGWKVAPRLLLAVDAIDVSNVTDDGPFFNVGAELKAGNNLAVRAGLMDDGEDNNLTAGLGIRINKSWRLDGAYADLGDGDTYWMIGGGLSF